MHFRIKWTTRAQSQFIRIGEFIAGKWGVKAAIGFQNQLHEYLAVIEFMPTAFPEIAGKSNWRRCVVTKRTVMFYRIEKQTVIIAGIYDTRMNPDSFLL